MSKHYKAIFFDWDGTAVLSRSAPADMAAFSMKKLLQQGVRLAVISGTTIENIDRGRLHTRFTIEELQNLYYGLGRGAYNYAFQAGEPCVLHSAVPDSNTLLQIHRACFELHEILFREYGFPTDIVFSRPSYCKIDLMVDLNRGDLLFFQSSELQQLEATLQKHGFQGGLDALIRLAQDIGHRHGLTVLTTSDAKYLEVGLTSKSDNVDFLLRHLKDQYGIVPEECCFWGDEFVGLSTSLFGSDSFMLTSESRKGDFYDVSDAAGARPDGVTIVGGGVDAFLDFLGGQAESLYH